MSQHIIYNDGYADNIKRLLGELKTRGRILGSQSPTDHIGPRLLIDPIDGPLDWDGMEPQTSVPDSQPPYPMSVPDTQPLPVHPKTGKIIPDSQPPIILTKKNLVRVPYQRPQPKAASPLKPAEFTPLILKSNLAPPPPPRKPKPKGPPPTHAGLKGTPIPTRFKYGAYWTKDGWRYNEYGERIEEGFWRAPPPRWESPNHYYLQSTPEPMPGGIFDPETGYTTFR